MKRDAGKQVSFGPFGLFGFYSYKTLLGECAFSLTLLQLFSCGLKRSLIQIVAYPKPALINKPV